MKVFIAVAMFALLAAYAVSQDAPKSSPQPQPKTVAEVKPPADVKTEVKKVIEPLTVDEKYAARTAESTQLEAEIDVISAQKSIDEANAALAKANDRFAKAQANMEEVKKPIFEKRGITQAEYQLCDGPGNAQICPAAPAGDITLQLAPKKPKS
jgi:peptidoglycan hydrolase CwlO-like protein